MSIRLGAATACLVVVVGLLVLDLGRDGSGGGLGSGSGAGASIEVVTTTMVPTTVPDSPLPSTTLPVATTTASGPDGADSGPVAVGGLVVDPRSSQRPWSDIGAVDGLLTFRGNPTRSFYGRGPVPSDPEVLWSNTIGCSTSAVGSEAKVWCGTGWTGQPAVFPAPSGAGSEPAWWVGVGGYNRKVNFFDPDTGAEVLPAFATGDIIKGSITVDPDGFPLVYSGSRDNYLHVIAIDGDEPRELWRLSATEHQPTLWNNDWDSSPIVVGGHLFIGGENSRFYAIELNRGFDADGSVTVEPEVVFTTEGWDDQLLADLGDRQVSIENSVAMAGSVVYFANSGGLVQGWDVAGLTDGREPERVFRYWVGDDTDASVVVDDEGMLYVVSEYERGNQRARDLGQVFKLDPSGGTGDADAADADEALVWSREASSGLDTGVWATAALWGELVIVATDDGRVLGLDRADGRERWVLELPGPLWSSPVVVDDILIQGDCNGSLHAFDLGPVGDEIEPPRARWSLELGGCIESTPAVWDGRIYVGTRTGEFYAIGDRG